MSVSAGSMPGSSAILQVSRSCRSPVRLLMLLQFSWQRLTGSALKRKAVRHRCSHLSALLVH